MHNMRTKSTIMLLVVWLTCVAAAAQTEPETPLQTTVCDLVGHPLEFKGKLVRVRAQIWSLGNKSWLNESWAGSKQFWKACRWLPAEFAHPTGLFGSFAFATFTGRLVYDSGRATGSVHVPCVIPTYFAVEAASDIYGQENRVGLVVVPLLYDRGSNTLLRPEGEIVSQLWSPQMSRDSRFPCR
jgi:hypothetical protein